MLHFIHVAPPFLVFAVYTSLTNLEPLSKLIHQHKNDFMSHSHVGILWFRLHFRNFIILNKTRYHDFGSFSLFSLFLNFFFILFWYYSSLCLFHNFSFINPFHLSTLLCSTLCSVMLSRSVCVFAHMSFFLFPSPPTLFV